jgi:Pvc16 N-terminal domain
MLDATVKFLADEVNLYLKRRTASSVMPVVPGGLTDDEGKWAVAEGNIGLALVNVEEERTLRAQVPERVFRNGGQVLQQPELKLNLLVVFAARHKSYEHALRYLSYILTFFQSYPVFKREEYPALDAGIDKLTLELVSYGPEQLNQLWAYIGTKYLPSVIYRVRMVVLQDAEPDSIGQPITTIETVLNDK